MLAINAAAYERIAVVRHFRIAMIELTTQPVCQVQVASVKQAM